ncbi:hypothetical protein SZ64_09310 [Erythrobacter sp. SG61-1L]|uniref:hypothetical protein n=1 Tax=Erythrobacter sp. SG61-1L TaxID=1603897 RepID=UPI0006C92B1F|nr:hypothetical protein [Erythrobacter sp. SG61-1L]KPL68299.1 hypothetical protein SZ64_09310 [Erythrobacter sp. SG61-1L]
MIPRQNEAEAALDRALSRASTPQVPPGLAGRIVADVTRLPQDAPGLARADASRSHDAGRGRLATAFAISAVLAIGLLGTALITRSGERGMPPPDRLLAADAPRPAEPGPLVPEGQPSPLASADTVSPRTAAANSRDSSLPIEAAPPETAAAQPKSASHTTQVLAAQPAITAPASLSPPLKAQEPVELARQGDAAAPSAIGPVDPSASPAPVYGPPATQGLGVAGGKASPPATQGPPRGEPAHSGPGPNPSGPAHPW